MLPAGNVVPEAAFRPCIFGEGFSGLLHPMEQASHSMVSLACGLSV